MGGFLELVIPTDSIMKMTFSHFHNAYHGFVLSEKDSKRKLLNFIEISPVPRKQAQRATIDWQSQRDWLKIV